MEGVLVAYAQTLLLQAVTLMRPPATSSNPPSYQPALIEFISEMLVCIMLVYCTHVTICHVVLAVSKILVALETTIASKHHPTPLAFNKHTQLRRISPYDSGTCKHAAETGMTGQAIGAPAPSPNFSSTKPCCKVAVQFL